MASVWYILVSMCALIHSIHGINFQVDIFETSPPLGQQLAAAAEAALEVFQEEYSMTNMIISETQVVDVEPNEKIALPTKICEQAAIIESDAQSQTGKIALGGGDGRTAALTAAAAATAGIPLFLVQPTPANSSWAALSLYPHDSVISAACSHLVKIKDWKRAVLLYEGSAETMSIIAPDDNQRKVTARQIPPDSDSALLRNLLLLLKKSGETNFILWCDAKCAFRVLDAAQRVGLLADRHSYIISSLELHTQDLRNFSYGGANITGLMYFPPNSPNITYAMSRWETVYRAKVKEAADEDEINNIIRAPPTPLLLAYDAVLLAAYVMKEMDLPPVLPQGPTGCGDRCSFFHADTLLNFMRSSGLQKDFKNKDKEEGFKKFNNITAIGGLVWEADGTRRNMRLTVVELQQGGVLESAGSWTPALGVMWNRTLKKVEEEPPESMTNRTFTFLIAESPPYIMKQKSIHILSGNDRYEGFCIDLIKKLAEDLNFNYTLREDLEKDYGGFNETTKEWTGMMKKLRDNPDIHFAITDLTITAERERGVDFTTPFMNLGISILFSKPKPPEPKMFGFLLPFSNGVWICLAIAYFVTSLIFYVVGRLCPEEWQNPYPCIEEPPALENQFTLANAFWFCIGAILLQGTEIAPIGYGTRAMASAWWVFALVITSSYTANLATLLAKKTSNDLIHNAEELANNPYGIKYGAKLGGSTYTFFEHSKHEVYQKMFKHMKEHESEMPGDNNIGINKVTESKGEYAFLMESTTIEYTIERNCAVTMVGGLLDSKGYGIAMKKESPFRQALNLALLKLQETGVLREMKHIWWKEKHGGGACAEPSAAVNENLTMKNFVGIFLVLLVGCFIGIVISCCDLARTAYKKPRDPELPFTKNFMSELRFVFHFNRSEKPLEGPLSLPPSESAHSNTDATEEGSIGEEVRSRSRSADIRSRSRSRSRSASPAASQRRRSTMRRRSSMHQASIRLARHTRPRDSSTPGRRRSPR